MALVLQDELLVGMITLEDVIETLIRSEIFDEDDEESMKFQSIFSTTPRYSQLSRRGAPMKSTTILPTSQ